MNLFASPWTWASAATAMSKPIATANSVAGERVAAAGQGGREPRRQRGASRAPSSTTILSGTGFEERDRARQQPTPNRTARLKPVGRAWRSRPPVQGELAHKRLTATQPVDDLPGSWPSQRCTAPPRAPRTGARRNRAPRRQPRLDRRARRPSGTANTSVRSGPAAGMTGHQRTRMSCFHPRCSSTPMKEAGRPEGAAAHFQVPAAIPPRRVARTLRPSEVRFHGSQPLVLLLPVLTPHGGRDRPERPWPSRAPPAPRVRPSWMRPRSRATAESGAAPAVKARRSSRAFALRAAGIRARAPPRPRLATDGRIAARRAAVPGATGSTRRSTSRSPRAVRGHQVPLGHLGQ